MKHHLRSRQYRLAAGTGKRGGCHAPGSLRITIAVTGFGVKASIAAPPGS